MGLWEDTNSKQQLLFVNLCGINFRMSHSGAKPSPVSSQNVLISDLQRLFEYGSQIKKRAANQDI